MLGDPNFQKWRVRFSYVHQSSILQYSSTSSVPSRDSEWDTVNGNKDKTEPMPNAMGKSPTKLYHKAEWNQGHRKSVLKVWGQCLPTGISTATSKEECVPPQRILQKDSKQGSPSLKMGPLSQYHVCTGVPLFLCLPSAADLISSGLLTFPQHWV